MTLFPGGFAVCVCVDVLKTHVTVIVGKKNRNAGKECRSEFNFSHISPFSQAIFRLSTYCKK